MSNYLWIQNGRVIDPANERDEIGDIFAKDGLLIDSLSEQEKAEATTYDASKVVCPGLVDIQVHLREPGQVHKEL